MAKKVAIKKTAVKKVPVKKVPVKKASVKKSVVKKSKPKQPESTDVVKRKKKNPTETLAEAIVEGMREKKAKQIVMLDLRHIPSAVTDFFVVCQGTSTTHVDSIANSVEDAVVKKLKTNPSHVEGYQNAEWILLDYFDVVVHVFLEEKRDFYRIERLWADAVLTTIKD